LLYLFAQIARMISDYWLVIWSSQSLSPDPGVGFYLGVYFGSKREQERDRETERDRERE